MNGVRVAYTSPTSATTVPTGVSRHVVQSKEGLTELSYYYYYYYQYYY
jgi:hypothetical protein